MKKTLLFWALTAIFAVGCQTDNTSDNIIGNIANYDSTTLDIALSKTRV